MSSFDLVLQIWSVLSNDSSCERQTAAAELVMFVTMMWYFHLISPVCQTSHHRDHELLCQNTWLNFLPPHFKKQSLSPLKLKIYKHIKLNPDSVGDNVRSHDVNDCSCPLVLCPSGTPVSSCSPCLMTSPRGITASYTGLTSHMTQTHPH